MVLPPTAALPQTQPAPPAAPAAPDAPPSAAVGAIADEDTPDDMVLDPAQPEFTLVNLPTTLDLPRHRMAFRVTHRFARDLSQGDFGDLLADFLGFDSGALIGLEFRVGVARGWQAGIYRTSDRTIQLFTQYTVLRQGPRRPLSLDALASFEGTNNLDNDDPRQPSGEGQRSPALGVVVSRVIGHRASLNATVAWVDHTNPLRDADDDDHTVLAGVGGRLRIRPTVYLVGEVTPRLAGYGPGVPLASFGIEKRAGGHAFQVSVSNGLGSTPAQVARGGLDGRWHVGFNINRKFF
jgi:hypothetical protein